MITRNTIKRLEKMLKETGEMDYLVIPLFATSEEAEVIRQEAKRQGKKALGTPFADLRKNKEKF